MRPAHARPTLAGFRDTVMELTEAGLPLGDVQDAIDAQSALTEDQKAALWLFAFSLHDRSEKRRQARALLAVARVGPGGEPRKKRPIDRPRPREFDARGFPVPQRSRSFLDRVARLLNPE
jgi:hypothetical protein